MNTRSVSSSLSGFSLVELLVVIAIMSICMALVMPGFTGSRRLANKTKCLSNLRQIGVAETLYATEWNGQFTPAYSSGGSWVTWENRLIAFVDINTGINVSKYQSRSVFLCPELLTRSGYSESLQWRCYFLNVWINNDNATLHWNFKRMAPPEPAKTILIAEGRVTNTESVKPDDGLKAGNSGVSTMEYRHGDGANYLFCDGHVEWIKGTVSDLTLPSLWHWKP